MSYRQPHNLRVVTLSSRESRGNVLYPPEFAHLASAPDPGDATDAHPPRAGETRGITIAETLLALSIGLSVFGFIAGTAWPLGVAAALLVGGCVVTR